MLLPVVLYSEFEYNLIKLINNKIFGKQFNLNGSLAELHAQIKKVLRSGVNQLP